MIRVLPSSISTTSHISGENDLARARRGPGAVSLAWTVVTEWRRNKLSFGHPDRVFARLSSRELRALLIAIRSYFPAAIPVAPVVDREEVKPGQYNRAVEADRWLVEHLETEEVSEELAAPVPARAERSLGPTNSQSYWSSVK